MNFCWIFSSIYFPTKENCNLQRRKKKIKLPFVNSEKLRNSVAGNWQFGISFVFHKHHCLSPSQSLHCCCYLQRPPPPSSSLVLFSLYPFCLSIFVRFFQKGYIKRITFLGRTGPSDQRRERETTFIQNNASFSHFRKKCVFLSLLFH